MPDAFNPGERFGIGFGGKIILDAEAARRLNAIRREVMRLGKVKAQPPLYWQEEPTGRAVSLNAPVTITAMLTGSTSPYSFTEQVFDGTSWSNAVGGYTDTNAYEYNARSGLGGQRARLTFKPTSNDWRFAFLKQAGAATTTVTGNVRGCISGTNLPVSGMSVVLTSGMTTLGTGTTNSSGIYSIPVSIATTTTITATVTPLSARFATSSASASVPVTGGTVNVTLSPATGYHCIGGCAYPVYQTLTVVDPTYGTFTATWTSSVGAPFGAFGAGWTTGFQALSYAGGGTNSCAAGTLNIEYVMFPNIASGFPLLDGGYWAASAISGSCPVNVSTNKDVIGWTNLSYTCPGASTSPTFTASVTNPDTSWEATAPYTITYHE